MFPFLDFLIALKALDGFLDMIVLKVRLDSIWRDLTQSLESFLLSLHNLLIKTEEELEDLLIFKFFLIWARRGHLGGLGGGGESDCLISCSGILDKGFVDRSEKNIK